MSSNKPIKGPGRGGAAFRTGPMVENPGKMLGRLMGYIYKNYRIHIIVVVIGIVVSVLANVQGTMFMKTLIDQYIMPLLKAETPDFHPLAMAILRVACFYAIGVACTYTYNRLMIYVSQGTLRNLRNEMFERMETLPVKYFDTHAHGDIMSVYTNDIDTLRQMISQSIPQLISSVITIVSVLVSMIILNIPLTLVTLFMVGVMLFASKNLAGLSGKYFMEQQKNLGIVNGYIEEMMEGQKVVKVFCHEEESLEKFNELNDQLFESANNANKFANVLMPTCAQIGNISAMETVKMSFGEKGGIFFSFLNVLQLVGWTAIMIYDGALAADGVLHTGSWVWCLVIGALIVLWIFIGITNLGKINTIAMAALFILTLVLCKLIFFDGGTALAIGGEAMSFGAAVELSVAMPLSWLPLISDYTREAKEPVKATAVSSVVYGLVSCWMYVIGMGAAIYTGESDIAQIMVKAGLGIAGLLIIVFSTVTTTFLDAYSAGISSESVFSKINGKYAAIAVTIIGTIAAIVYPMDNITDFLYLIGSVFAPMIAIQIADFFLLKRTDSLGESVDVTNAVIWVIGFVLYRILMRIDIPVGNTLPDMVITILICMVARSVWKNKK